MVLRCTAKLLKLLGKSKAKLAEAAPSDDDWYANLIWIDRRKCLILAHAGTLFPIVAVDVRAGDLRPIGPYVAGLIQSALNEERLPPTVFGELDPNEVITARTASRSVLSHMNQMVEEWRWLAGDRTDLTHVEVINHRLRRTLVSRDGDYWQPLELVARHL